MKRLLLIPFLAFMLSSCNQSPKFDVALEDFKFSLEWGIYSDASYNSDTKVLVKTKCHYEKTAEDYTAKYTFPNMEELYNKVKAMNPYAYPDNFDPYKSSNHLMSTPYKTYKLTVNDKTILIESFYITRAEVQLSKKGEKFFEVVDYISETIENSEEWKNLPEPEYLYY